MLAEITKYKENRFLWITLLFGLQFLKSLLIFGFSLPIMILIWLVIEFIFLILVFGLISARSNASYAIGNIIGILFSPLAAISMFIYILVEGLKELVFLFIAKKQPALSNT